MPETSLLERSHSASVTTLPGAGTHLSEIATLRSLSYEDPLAILGSAPHPNEPWWKRVSPSTILVLLAGAIGIFFLLHELLIGGGLGFPTDESWIEQVYARNFFHDVSFEFNPGETTAGPTAPLWVVALAVGNGIFHQPMLAAKLLGAVFLFLAGYYTFRLLRTTEHDYGTSLLAAVLVLSSQYLAWAELSGLESTVSATLVTAGLWWFFHSRSGWRRSLTGALFALAALTRPESGIVFLLLLGYATRHSDHEDGSRDGHRLRDPLLMLLLFAIILIPIGITNVAISGSVVPVTFFAGLARESLPVLLRHGQVGEIALRLLYSTGSVASAVWYVYLPTHPFFVATILIALFERRRNRWLQKNDGYSLLSLSVVLLVGFPYFRAVTLGVNDNFAEAARSVHFIEPIFVVAGVLSVIELVQSLTLRVLSPRQTLYAGACAIAVAAVVYLAVRPETAASFFTIKASIDYILLLFFIGVLLSVALAYAGIHPFKPETPATVTEAERSEYTYHSYEETEGDRRLPPPVKNVLRGLLLVALGWNLTELPRAANQYGEDVRSMRSELSFAKVVSQATEPNDVIAADRIGALGWVSERRISDLQGRLAGNASYNLRAYGIRGAGVTLEEARPQYVAIFSPEFRPLIEEPWTTDATGRAAFAQVAASDASNGARLYRFFPRKQVLLLPE